MILDKISGHIHPAFDAEAVTENAASMEKISLPEKLSNLYHYLAALAIEVKREKKIYPKDALS